MRKIVMQIEQSQKKGIITLKLQSFDSLMPCSLYTLSSN